MKISKRNLNRLIESLLSGSEFEMSLEEKAILEINSLSQGDKDLLDNYLESISPNLNTHNILNFKEIDLEKEEFEQLNDPDSTLSELIKSLIEKDEEHITSYIKEITPIVEEHLSGEYHCKYWYKDGKLHREGDKPAEIWYRKDGSIEREYWFKDGKEHREGDNPAKVWYYEDGSIREAHWYKDGHAYREGDEPAMASYRENGSIWQAYWFKDGRIVRTKKGRPPRWLR